MNSVPDVEPRGAQIASGLIPSSLIEGGDEQDTTLLLKMSEEAFQYISSFSWCDDIHHSYFGGGVGGIFAVFFFHIRATRPHVDPWIWIIVGDIPPAYLPLSDCGIASRCFPATFAGRRDGLKWRGVERTFRLVTLYSTSQLTRHARLGLTPQPKALWTDARRWALFRGQL